MRVLCALGSNNFTVFLDTDEEFVEAFRREMGPGEEGEVVDDMTVELLINKYVVILRTINDLIRALQRVFVSCQSRGGHACVIRKMDGLVFMGIHDRLSERALASQLLLLRDFTHMFALPVIAVGPKETRTSAWARLAKLMKKAEELTATEQPFLVEGLEFVSNNRSKFQDMLLGAFNSLKDKTWGCHAILFMGDKVLAVHSRPNAPELRPRDVFLINILLQGMLTPSFNSWSEDCLPTAVGPEVSTPRGPSRSHGSIPDSDTHGSWEKEHFESQPPSPAPGGEDPPTPLGDAPAIFVSASAAAAGVQPPPFTPVMAASTPRPLPSQRPEEAFHEARSTSWGSGPHEELDQIHGAAAAASSPPKSPSLRPLERHLIYLRGASGNYLPYTLHTVEIYPSVALVIISEGTGQAMCDLMHVALRSVTRILEISDEQEREAELQAKQDYQEAFYFMSVRGSTNQVASDAIIDGSYYPMEGMDNHGRPSFEKSTRDLYLFYHALYRAWCIGPELNSVAVVYAMAEDEALSPEAITARWETYDHDVRKHVVDANMKIRCVRKDGCVRTRDGRWARLAPNGLFYCGGAAVCTCGICNGVCGPRDGCNCASCKLLHGTVGFGESAMPAQSLDETRVVREQQLKKELEPLRSAVSRLLVQGSAKLDKSWHDRLLNALNNVVNAIGGSAGVSWNWFPTAAGDLFVMLNNGVGGYVLETNMAGTREEAQRAEPFVMDMRERLKDHPEFFAVKLKCNVSQTLFMESFPSLLHFILVNRTTESMVAPALIAYRNGEAGVPGGEAGDRMVQPTLRTMVWRLHALASAYLLQGYTTMMRRSGDYTLSYFLWFEDPAGNRLTPTANQPVPALVEGSGFYKELVSSWFPQARPGAVVCLELFLINFSVVPLEFVAVQAQAFARFLRNTVEI